MAQYQIRWVCIRCVCAAQKPAWCHTSQLCIENDQLNGHHYQSRVWLEAQFKRQMAVYGLVQQCLLQVAIRGLVSYNVIDQVGDPPFDKLIFDLAPIVHKLYSV